MEKQQVSSLGHNVKQLLTSKTTTSISIPATPIERFATTRTAGVPPRPQQNQEGRHVVLDQRED